MPLAKVICTTSSLPVLASRVFPSKGLCSSPGEGALGGEVWAVTTLLKGVFTMALDDADGLGEFEDFGPEIAADEAEEVETGPPEIWVVRRAKPVRLPVEDVPDPLGCLTVPGTPVPRVEEIVFPGLTLLGTAGLGACTEGFSKGRAGLTPAAEGGGETATHSSTSTYQTAGEGAAGTCSQ